MAGAAAGVIVSALLCALVPAPASGRAQALEPGLLLYAAPGLPDPNFAKTVILLVEHGPKGSLGVVLNQPTDRDVGSVLDLKDSQLDMDLPVFWGGPVQPAAVLVLLRAARPALRTRTVIPGVQVTGDLEQLKAALADPISRLRVRVFSGYAGWDAGQLAAEVRRGSWVIDRADVGTIFTPEPSRLWERVYEIVSRLRAEN